MFIGPKKQEYESLRHWGVKRGAKIFIVLKGTREGVAEEKKEA